jgi:thiol-disulfide isomerase/thioredoxin
LIPDYPFEFSVINNIRYMAHSKNILSILVVLLVLSCSQDKTITNTITGEISDYDHKVLMIDSDTLTVTDGKFEITIPPDYPVYRNLMYGKDKKFLFLMPGYAMKIKFNASDFYGSFKIEGDGVNENIVLDSMEALVINESFWDRINNEDAVGASKYLDSCRTAYLNILEKLNKEYPTSEIFMDYEKADMEYFFGGFKIAIGLKNNVTDSVYYDFTRNIVVENEKYLGIIAYKQFLTNYIDFIIWNSNGNLNSLRINKPDSLLDATLSHINTYKSEKIKEYLRYYFIKERLEDQGIEGFDKYYNYFETNNTDSSYAEEMKKLYDQKLKLIAGTNAPDFYCSDAEGASHSLKEFLNKIVYIDFWATWCGPCKKEMPDFLDLQEEYKGKDIVFIRISLDDDINRWLKVEESITSEGISWFAGKGFGSEAAKAFQVISIPTYVLIDKEGKIVNADALRPSSVAIRGVLDDLLSKKH